MFSKLSKDGVTGVFFFSLFMKSFSFFYFWNRKSTNGMGKSPKPVVLPGIHRLIFYSVVYDIVSWLFFRTFFRESFIFDMVSACFSDTIKKPSLDMHIETLRQALSSFSKNYYRVLKYQLHCGNNLHIKTMRKIKNLKYGLEPLLNLNAMFLI